MTGSTTEPQVLRNQTQNITCHALAKTSLVASLQLLFIKGEALLNQLFPVPHFKKTY